MSALVEVVVPRRLGISFRWLLASSWLANLGDGIALAAGPLLVASLTREPYLVASAALLTWAPPLVVGLVAGVVSDRSDRRRVLMAANVARAVVLVALVATVVTGTVTVVGVLAALAAISTAEVFADNTSVTISPMLVHRDDLGTANSRLTTGFITVNQLAGPPIGAALFAAGHAWPFATECLLVLAASVMVSRIVLPPHGRRAAADATVDAARPVSGVRRDLVEGFRWTWGHSAVRTLALTILLFNLTFGASWSVLVLYARDRLGMGPLGFGLLTTVSAVGGLLGTALYGWITRRVSLGNVMRVGLVIETFTHLALALTTSPWLASAIFFVFGAHAFIWGTTSTTVRQRAVPSELQGRVGSVYTLAVYGGLVVGSALGGVLATHYGLTAPFWFGFGGSAVFVVVLWPRLTRIAHSPH